MYIIGACLVPPADNFWTWCWIFILMTLCTNILAPDATSPLFATILVILRNFVVVFSVPPQYDIIYATNTPKCHPICQVALYSLHYSLNFVGCFGNKYKRCPHLLETKKANQDSLLWEHTLSTRMSCTRCKGILGWVVPCEIACKMHLHSHCWLCHAEQTNSSVMWSPFSHLVESSSSSVT